MKMDKTKKRVYFNTRIKSLFISIFFLILAYGGVAFLIYEWFDGKGTNIKILFFVFPIFVILALFFTIIFLIGILKFIIIDEEKIISRTANGKVGEIKWQDIKEVRLKMSGSNPYEIVFVDKIVDVPESQKTIDDRERINYIFLKYDRKREHFLKQLKSDLSFIIEEDKEEQRI